MCLGERAWGTQERGGLRSDARGRSWAGVDGRVTPKGMGFLGAGGQADHVLQTPHPDTTQQGTQGHGLDFLPGVYLWTTSAMTLYTSFVHTVTTIGWLKNMYLIL